MHSPDFTRPYAPPTLADLPPTAKMAFRFHQGHKLLLICEGHAYEGDLVEPERWAHLPVGTALFVRLPGPREAAPIVKAVVLNNLLGRADADETGSNCVLGLDLNPDRAAGESAIGETVIWQRGQMQTLFLYWPRLPNVVYRRDA